MIEAMEKIKQDRFRAERVDILKARFDILGVAILTFRRLPELREKQFPRLRDLASFPIIRQIIEAPSEVVIEAKDFVATAPQIPNLVAQWEKSRLSHLSHLVRQKVVIPSDIDPSDLAVGQMYECQRCNRLYEYPRVLGHHCFRQRRGKATEIIYEDLTDEILQCYLDFPINPRVDIVKSILDAFGCDHTRCTAQEIDALDLRLRCTRCEVPGQIYHEVMNWRCAVSIYNLYISYS